MALTPLQRRVARLLAGRRLAGGESYLAGAAALGAWLGTPRVSRDLDLFHDTEEAVARSWERDRRDLEGDGFSIRALVERPGFVRAAAAAGGGEVLLEWARDSAFRFFPLVLHEELGLSLHPFDLATNKVLALVGRREARDWVDTIECDDRFQPLGLLAFAACGKDPGFSPGSILAEARRANRFAREEVGSLVFSGPAPDAADLSRRWRASLARAEEAVAALPPAEAGRAVLLPDGSPFRGGADEIRAALASRGLLFHPGRIGGAWPAFAAPSGRA